MAKTNKVKTLTLAGKKYKLNVGIPYFHKFFIEATGVDLIKQGLIDAASVKSFEYTAGFIYAGVKAEHALHKTSCDLKFEDVQHEVMGMSEDAAGELFTECLALYSGMSVEDFKEHIKKTIAQAVNS